MVGFYQWSRGVQIRANLDLMMDWFQSMGLGELATDFFQKLSAAVNLLATPKETLLQVRGRPFLLQRPSLTPSAEGRCWCWGLELHVGAVIPSDPS